MHTRCLGTLSFVAALAACGGATSGPAAAPVAPVRASPELEAKAEQAHRLGHAIFAQDKASALATDVMVAAHAMQKDSGGWITLGQSDGWLVRFLAKREGAHVVTHDVRFSPPNVPVVIPLEPPQPLDGEQAAMFGARCVAVAALTASPEGRCPGPYNAVILPAALLGKTGWLVYLLAATTDPNLIIRGGHHRYVVSEDGTRLVEHMAMSTGCAADKRPTATEGELAAIFLTTPITDYPLETHWFTALSYRVPMMIGTVETGLLWALDEARWHGGSNAPRSQPLDRGPGTSN